METSELGACSQITVMCNVCIFGLEAKLPVTVCVHNHDTALCVCLCVCMGQFIVCVHLAGRG